MAEAPVLRFPISEKKNEFFLLQVISNGKNPLDVRLLGTEGTGAYEAKLRHRRNNEWKASSGHCTDEEWERVLVSTLVEPDSHQLKDIEIRVDVQSDSSTLNFRKNIQGITQRLGSIKLEEFEIVTDAKTGDDNGPQLFDWCAAAIGSRAKVVEDLAVAKGRIEKLEASVDELRNQLEDLLKAKEADEVILLEKFRDLLNEKKLKIRQQHRLLASAQVDPVKLENVGASQNSVRKAKTSRVGKRKATRDLSDDHDEGFEIMDVDSSAKVKDEPEDDVEMNAQDTTDEEADQATESDDEESDQSLEPVQKPVATRKGKAVAKPPLSRRSKASASTKRTERAASLSSDEEEDEDKTTTPSTSLPLQNRSKQPAHTSLVDNDETESDDEL